MSKITISDYIHSANKLLANENDRGKIFELIKEKLRAEKPEVSTWGIRTLIDLIEGTSVLFNDPGIPGFYKIIKQREQIAEEGKKCLRDCFDSIKRLAVKAEDTQQIIDYTYVVIKYLVEVDPDVESYTDIYLILAYNLLRARNVKYNPERVENLILKGFLRYDAGSFAKHVRGDIELAEDYKPYKFLSEVFYKILREGSIVFMIKNFIPLLFTDKIILKLIDDAYSLRDIGKDFLLKSMKKSYTPEKLKDILGFIKERANFLGIPHQELDLKIYKFLEWKLKFVRENLLNRNFFLVYYEPIEETLSSSGIDLYRSITTKIIGDILLPLLSTKGDKLSPEGKKDRKPSKKTEKHVKNH